MRQHATKNRKCVPPETENVRAPRRGRRNELRPHNVFYLRRGHFLFFGVPSTHFSFVHEQKIVPGARKIEQKCVLARAIFGARLIPTVSR